LQDKDKTITARWNKTVLEYYRTFTVDTYKVFQQPFKNWFELGQTIVMDSSEYKTIPFLYNEYWDDELEYFKNKCTVAQIAYINLHILTNKYIESTSSKDNGKKISIRKAVILVYSKNKNKFPVWKTGSLNKYYHNGGNLMVDK
jgi:hypothetical protein